MSSFAALMALSASQSRENEAVVQHALAERRRKEEERRKKQESDEKKQREREALIRSKRFEDEKRELERQERLEREREAKEREFELREQEQRQVLMYGPKKTKSEYPTSNSSSREEVRRRRLPSPEDSAATSLTREEKRRRKYESEVRRSYQGPKRSSHSSGRKVGRLLPGGAIDITTTASGSGQVDSGGYQSVKARLAAIPNTLTKLNVVKRDTRTIDEILQDRAKERETKVLAGDQAKEFNDWFGTSKKKDKAKRATAPASTPGTGTPSTQTRSTKSASPALSTDAVAASARNKKSAVVKAHSSSISFPTKAVSSNDSKSLGASVMLKSTAVRPPPLDLKASTMVKATSNGAKTPTLGNKATSSGKLSSTSARPPMISQSSTLASKKRPRSSSYSDSPSPPPSAKKRATPADARPGDLSSEIWKIFGKERSQYVSRDIFSDDEDMEVDARILEKEELRSSRIAKKEEELALEQERRREEEKRRRKKERDSRERAERRN